MRVAEERSDELRGTIRFVAARETARDHDQLRGSQTLGEGLDRTLDVLGISVADDEHVRVDAGSLQRAGGVVLTVGAGEDRDQGCWPGVSRRSLLTQRGTVGAAGSLLDRLGASSEDGGLTGVVDDRRVDILESVEVLGLELVERHDLIAETNLGFRNDFTEKIPDDLGLVGPLENHRAVGMAEDRLSVDGIVVREAQTLAKAHLEHALGNTAKARRPSAYGSAGAKGAHRGLEDGEQRFGGR